MVFIVSVVYVHSVEESDGGECGCDVCTFSNNNVHLSYARQRPEHSHDTY